VVALRKPLDLTPIKQHSATNSANADFPAKHQAVERSNGNSQNTRDIFPGHQNRFNTHPSLRAAACVHSAAGACWMMVDKWDKGA
jgi:hypothetical protein